MSDTSMTKKMMLLVTELGFTLKQLQWLSVNAMKSSFIPFEQRLKLINKVIKPYYTKIAQDLGIKF
jgi:adenosine deaminase